MNKYIFLTLIVAFSLFASLGFLARNPVPVLASAGPLQVVPSVEELTEHVEFLVELQPFRNDENIQSLDRAASYIETRFKKHCPQVQLQNFQVNKLPYKNVICIFPGESKKRIVIGAHYDVQGDQPGADDNASGVAGILELARLISENKPQLENDIEIVAYTLEEPPNFRTDNMGSYIHAQSLAESNIDVQFMLSVEMIGYFSDEPWSQSFPLGLLYGFYPNKGNFVALVGRLEDYMAIRPLKQTLNAAMTMEVFSLNAPASIPGIDFSDHLNYWKFGYPAFMITDTSFYRNDNYHEITDTIDTLNFEKMADVVVGLYALVQ